MLMKSRGESIKGLRRRVLVTRLETRFVTGDENTNQNVDGTEQRGG